MLLWRAATRAYRAYPPDGAFILFTKATAKRLIRPLLIVAVLLGLGVTVGRSVNKSLHKPPPPPRTVQTHRRATSPSRSPRPEPSSLSTRWTSKARRRAACSPSPFRKASTSRSGQLIALVDRSLIDPQLAGDQAQLRQAQARLAQTQAEYALQVKQTAAAIAQAQAGLNTAQAHLAVVAAGARPQELAQQKEAVSRARIAYDDALRTQKRRQSLLGKGFISQADYDTSQVAVDTAASSLATAGRRFCSPRPGRASRM